MILIKWFTRNFSKPASPVIAQMFNFLNLGFDGYRKIAYKGLRNARLLSRALEKTYFTVCTSINYRFSQPLFISRTKQVISDIHRPTKAAKWNALNDTDNPESYDAGLPVVAFRYVCKGYIKMPFSNPNSRLSDEYVKENPQVKQEWIAVCVLHNY